MFLNRFLFRAIAVLLVPAVVVADPLWASGMAQGLPRPAIAACRQSPAQPLDYQAVVPQLVSGFRSRGQEVAANVCESAKIALAGTWERMTRRPLRSIGVSALLLASLRPSFPGQNKPQPPPNVTGAESVLNILPPDAPSDLALPDIKELMKEDEAITQHAITDDVWTQQVSVPDHIDSLDDFIMPLIDRNPDIYAQWLMKQSLVESWLAQMSPDVVEFITNDPNRGATSLLPQKGGYLNTLAGMTFYDRFADRNALRSVEEYTADREISNDSIWHRIWRNIKRGAPDLLFHGGIQKTSNVVLAKRVLRIVLKGTDLRIGNADLMDLAQEKTADFNRILYELLRIQFRIAIQDLKIRLADKDLADLVSHKQSNAEEVPWRHVTLKISKNDLVLERNALERDRQDRENELHRLLKTSA
ncbi:MAG TPA: hypothetical protein VMU17_07685, partial [Elusimicrobiota bacterium]|nr:hypothetical protein [Elusimicrobiota bacterium]